MSWHALMTTKKRIWRTPRRSFAAQFPIKLSLIIHDARRAERMRRDVRTRMSASLRCRFLFASDIWEIKGMQRYARATKPPSRPATLFTMLSTPYPRLTVSDYQRDNKSPPHATAITATFRGLWLRFCCRDILMIKFFYHLPRELLHKAIGRAWF